MAKYNRRNSTGYGLATPLPLLYNIPVTAQRAPTVADNGYDVGQVWIDRSTNQAWIMTNPSVWMLSSPGASDVDTINGLSPVAGNIIIDGGTNVTDVNAGNTVTLNLDPAITLATSVTSPIYASAAAMDINVAAGSDVTIQLGDAVGANILEIENSASAAVATIDSTGIATFVGMDGVLGGVTPAAATGTTITANTNVVSPIYTSGAGADTNINAVGGQDIVIQLGDAAGVNLININSSTPALVASIDSTGIATFAGMDGVLGGVTPAAATGTLITANTGFVGPYLIAPAATDTLVDSVAGQDLILRLGDAAGANFLRVQSSTPADVFTIDSLGTLAAMLGLNVTGNFAQTAGTFNVGQDNAANGINIGGGNVARAMGILNSAAAHTLTIGNAACGAFTIDTGAGISIDAATASNFTVTGAGADLDMGSVGGSVDLTASEAAADAIDIQATDAAGGINVDCGFWQQAEHFLSMDRMLQILQLHLLDLT